jgi:deoxyribodipyrimidine photo-lyase
MKTAIVWFRNDLRLHDHAPFTEALRRAEQVVPFYCFDERLFETTPHGFPRCGEHRLRFLVESVQALERQFAALGVAMHIVVGRPVVELLRLANECRATQVYYHREATTEEVADEKEATTLLHQAGCECRPFWGSTLLSLDDLPFPLGGLPQIFTEFRKQCEREGRILPALPAPKQARGLPNREATYPHPRLYTVNADARAVLSFEGGEAAGLARLQQYFWEEDRLKSYKETRNGMIGQAYSSKFSPWLAVGALSARYIYQEIKRYENERVNNESTYWLFFELLWRDYFRLVALRHGALLFQKGGIRQSQTTPSLKKQALKSWQAGKTGQPFIDANMRELQYSGFMSNRGRQNVASYLVHHLHCDWRAGAAWFENRLIDYDPCSNYGNWNYLAGVGNDPRENRVFNPEKQARQYDADGSYCQLWQA